MAMIQIKAPAAEGTAGELAARVEANTQHGSGEKSPPIGNAARPCLGELLIRQHCISARGGVDNRAIVFGWNAIAPFPSRHGLIWQTKIRCEIGHSGPDVFDVFHICTMHIWRRGVNMRFVNFRH
jgi:hypothetical protein